jgi:hypothetical protein
VHVDRDAEQEPNKVPPLYDDPSGLPDMNLGPSASGAKSPTTPVSPAPAPAPMPAPKPNEDKAPKPPAAPEKKTASARTTDYSLPLPAVRAAVSDVEPVGGVESDAAVKPAADVDRASPRADSSDRQATTEKYRWKPWSN